VRRIQSRHSEDTTAAEAECNTKCGRQRDPYGHVDNTCGSTANRPWPLYAQDDLASIQNGGSTSRFDYWFGGHDARFVAVVNEQAISAAREPV